MHGFGQGYIMRAGDTIDRLGNVLAEHPRGLDAIQAQLIPLPIVEAQ